MDLQYMFIFCIEQKPLVLPFLSTNMFERRAILRLHHECVQSHTLKYVKHYMGMARCTISPNHSSLRVTYPRSIAPRCSPCTSSAHDIPHLPRLRPREPNRAGKAPCNCAHSRASRPANLPRKTPRTPFYHGPSSQSCTPLCHTAHCNQVAHCTLVPTARSNPAGTPMNTHVSLAEGMATSPHTALQTSVCPQLSC
jgi:hypothetical protein